MAAINSTPLVSTGAALSAVAAIEQRLNEALALAISIKARIEDTPESERDLTSFYLAGLLEDLTTRTATGELAQLRGELEGLRA